MLGYHGERWQEDPEGLWLRVMHTDDRPRVLALLDEIMTSKTKEAWESTFRIVK